MSDLPFPSAVANVWPRTAGSSITGATTTGPTPIGGGTNPIGLPSINNPNLPLSTTINRSNIPPPVPQPPLTPFPSIRQPFGANSISTTPYATAPAAYPFNPLLANLAQNSAQNARNEANQRRLVQLEEENAQRRTTTSNLQQMGTHLLQNQMDVQEQVLQYQFMLEQCMETLDHQNFVLNGQAEELALLRAKMKHFEYLMDLIKHTKEKEELRKSVSGDANLIERNSLCSQRMMSLYGPSGSPFFPGGVTRVTSSKFQPFNPRYRSPTNRTPGSNQPPPPPSNTPPSAPNPSNNTPGRLSRPVSNMNK